MAVNLIGIVFVAIVSSISLIIVARRMLRFARKMEKYVNQYVSFLARWENKKF